MSDSGVRGRFVWHELLTTNTESAAAFFGKLLGWKTQVAPQDPSYTMFRVGTRQVAGLMVLPEEAKQMGAAPHWLTYVGVPDVDVSVSQAASLGATTLRPPTTIPDVGRYAVLRDPQGAVFAVFTPAEGSMGASAPPPSEFSWHELATTDWEAALTFYQQLFGWGPTDSMDMGPEAGKYQMYGLDGKTFGGMYRKPPQSPGPPAWLPYIDVADARKTAQAVKRHKGTVISGPMEVPGGGWITLSVDLEGSAFAVHSAKPAAPAAAASRKRAKAKAAAAKVRKIKRPARAAAKKTAKRKGAKKKVVKKKVVKKKVAKKTSVRRASGRTRAARGTARRRPAARSRARSSRRGR